MQISARPYIRIFIALLAICITMPVSNAMAQNKVELIKAAFLFRFIDYIDWPEPYSINEGARARICIVGNHNFDDILDIIKDKQNSKRNIQYSVKYFNDLDEINLSCHVLFSRQKLVKDKIDTNTLIVTDLEGASDYGAHIEMAMHGARVKLIINRTSAISSGLKISSRLLNVAKEVK